VPDEDGAHAAALRGLDHGEQLQSCPSGRRMLRQRDVGRGGAGSGAAARGVGCGGNRQIVRGIFFNKNREGLTGEHGKVQGKR
jgi:hypothetical protein